MDGEQPHSTAVFPAYDSRAKDSSRLVTAETTVDVL